MQTVQISLNMSVSKILLFVDSELDILLSVNFIVGVRFVANEVFNIKMNITYHM